MVRSITPDSHLYTNHCDHDSDTEDDTSHPHHETQHNIVRVMFKAEVTIDFYIVGMMQVSAASVSPIPMIVDTTAAATVPA